VESVDDELNPLQQAVIDALGVPTDWEPLPPHIITDIEEQLAHELAPIRGLFTAENPLRVNKHHIATVHGCEKYHVLNRQSQFAWNINTVRGTIAHKGIELLLNWRGPIVPAHIVDAAITSVADNPRESASDFIVSLPAHELAELRGAVLGAVTNFLECFPPIRPQWRPMVEYSASYSLFDGSVIFTSRMDLVLGGPGRKVLIDLKTGRLTPTHRDDLRFYALIETLRSRQAPRSLGSYSLDSARLDSEDVTEGLLQSAVRRTAHGTLLIADLVLETRQPELRPGFQCRWCPINDTCAEGGLYLRQLAGEEDDN
jgi:PD-(D/E)XK nuclease superfamily